MKENFVLDCFRLTHHREELSSPSFIHVAWERQLHFEQGTENASALWMSSKTGSADNFVWDSNFIG